MGKLGYRLAAILFSNNFKTNNQIIKEKYHMRGIKGENGNNVKLLVTPV